MTVRTRIAPSPTGELHIGHMRTILYDYALAKKHNGEFIVRIEDTDRNRFVEGSMERTLQTMEDYGISWDEGPVVGGPYEPYLQSQRLEIYKAHAEELVKKGYAYYCFCTPERLQKVREEQQKQGLARTGYDKHCRNLSQEEVEEKLKGGTSRVIRLKVPENRTITLHDAVHGDISFDSNQIDDAVLFKSDGYPTYHLAAMVDDHLMKITHVLRGIDWMPSSPLHVLIFEAFGWEMPVFVHLPNLKEKGMNTKLSKRYGSVAAADFLRDGYLPEALVNFLIFIGWNPGTDKEIYSLEEFIKDFSIEKVQSSEMAVFDRDKLSWYNGYYIRNKSPEELLGILENWSEKFGVELNSSEDSKYNLSVIALLQERLKTLAEFNELSQYFYQEPNIDMELLIKQTKDRQLTKSILEKFIEVFSSVILEGWDKNRLEELGHSVLEEEGLKPRDAFMTIRVAVTGSSATPPLFDTLELLGRKRVLARMERTLTLL
jgi:glutamyl-tRNA synthetase